MTDTTAIDTAATRTPTTGTSTTARRATSIIPDPKTRTVWFLTGSQGLYGEETLRQVAEQSREVAALLADADEIPVTIEHRPRRDLDDTRPRT